MPSHAMTESLDSHRILQRMLINNYSCHGFRFQTDANRNVIFARDLWSLLSTTVPTSDGPRKGQMPNSKVKRICTRSVLSMLTTDITSAFAA